MSVDPLRAFLDLPPEQRTIGPFRPVEQLGRGGFAPVFLADEILRRRARPARGAEALLLRRRPLDEPVVGGLPCQSIVREAGALCRVVHPSIVQFFTLVSDERRRLVGLAMELLEGRSLDHRLHHGVLDVDETLAAGIAVCSALSVVHDAAIVHRDVKPAEPHRRRPRLRPD